MKQVKQKVLAFMESVNTSEMDVNKFFYEFVCANWETGMFIEDYWDYNIEGVVRARRSISADHWIGVRTKADTQKVYINEYARENKY